MEVFATVLFGLAVLHTFTVKRFQHWAHRYQEGSVGENLFHFLGEVEVVFGLWAAALCAGIATFESPHAAIEYIESRNYTEPLFVFAIMTMAATRPILALAEGLIGGVARLIPGNRRRSFYISALILGPLLGSFITEPAAMTVVALILLKKFYAGDVSKRFKYATLGVLFVNVSIGGTLTHFAAPPVLMVAAKWNLGISEMLGLVGWKAAIAVTINTIGAAVLLRKDFAKDPPVEETDALMKLPWWMYVTHVGFIAFTVLTAHHAAVFIAAFLFFLGMVQVTGEYQTELKLKEALLVGFFLGGLVVLGGMQGWWIQPLLAKMDAGVLFVGTTGLTAVTDNAALTYLGSLVEGLSDESKMALLKGAVAGGGLTVIANAPNPAGFAILHKAFGDEGISPLGLLAGAAIPTLVAMVCLWFL